MIYLKRLQSEDGVVDIDLNPADGSFTSSAAVNELRGRVTSIVYIGTDTHYGVTLANGQKAEGVLNRVDDFIVTLTDKEGRQRSFTRNGDSPKVEIHDPLAPHKALLPVYTDKDIHDVTAYLVTLK